MECTILFTESPSISYGYPSFGFQRQPQMNIQPSMNTHSVDIYASSLLLQTCSGSNVLNGLGFVCATAASMFCLHTNFNSAIHKDISYITVLPPPSYDMVTGHKLNTPPNLKIYNYYHLN